MGTKIRNATLLDLPSILDFARSFGRFISADEIRTWLQIDPEALFVSETSPNGKLIGSCCGIRHSPELGFMGLYVVLEEYRGKGIGTKLWKAAKEHLGKRNIGLHGDPVNFKRYTEREGFCHVEDYTILYYECFGDCMSTDIVFPTNIEVATYFEGNLIGCSKKLSDDVSLTDEYVTYKVSGERVSSSETTCAEVNTTNTVECPVNSSVVQEHCNESKLSGAEYINESLPSSVTVEGAFPHSAHAKFPYVEQQIKPNIKVRRSFEEFEEISFNSTNQTTAEHSKAEVILSGVLTFDKLLHNRDRSLVVRQTFSWKTCRSKVALVGGKVVGYACLRHVVIGHWIIAPFYADTENVAETLLFELLQGFDFSLAPKGIQIRFPDKNIACKRLVEKLGFREKTIRLLTGFTKQCINIDTSKVYSFHSPIFCSE